MTSLLNFQGLAKKIVIVTILLCSLLKLDAQVNESIADEPKVDYLERIYFSGLNKEGLINLIQSTIQELETLKATTQSVARQYSFVYGIFPKAQAAEKACAILEYFAAGIYNLDVNEAVKQEIPRPSDKTNNNLSGILSASRSIGSDATNIAWTAFVLSKGSVSSLKTYGKVANVAGKVGTTVEGIEKGKKAVDDTKKLMKAFGLSKDKPCKDVPERTIQIGEHKLPEVPREETLTAVFKNVSFDQVSYLSEHLSKVANITSVNSDKFSNNTATFIITHTNLKISDLINKLKDLNKEMNFTVEESSTNSITLIKM